MLLAPYFQKSKGIITLFCLFLTTGLFAQDDPPWGYDPECGSIVTSGIAAATCGTRFDLDSTARWTVGLINVNGLIPASGRDDVSATAEMYHHPSWLVDSIGNVFGITTDDVGNIYVTASSNYSTDFFNIPSVIRYGDIGGGASDLNAAGTIYKLDGLTGQASVFAVLPQQPITIENVTCEGGILPSVVREETGPGLGNIAFHPFTGQFYVTNFEDGRIYRLDDMGNILDSYDPLFYDVGEENVPILEDLTYGITVSPDGTELFFGTVGDELLDSLFSQIYPRVYSIGLNSDGSFAGSIDNTFVPGPYDNYVGSETLHFQIPPIQIPPSSQASTLQSVSDLQFAVNGELMVGTRTGCKSTIHTSYSHGGRSIVLMPNAGTGLFDIPNHLFVSNGAIDDENCYGGVSSYVNSSAELEYVVTSADMINEDGPHGLSVTPGGEFGSGGTLPPNPVDPAAIIGYIVPFSSDNDPKGVGGDVYVFQSCNLVACPTEIQTEDVVVCSEEPFDLEFMIIGEGEVTSTWTNSAGDEVDPFGLMLTNADCAPLEEVYTITAVCEDDTSQVLTATLTVTVVTNDISPFITIIEEPCNVDVIIEPGCEEFLTVVGDIPVINPGDAGTVDVIVVQTTPISCDSFPITLTYDCSCSIDSLSAEPLECSDGAFDVLIDFTFENTSPQFEVFDQDGNSLGIFNYADLPVVAGPLNGDGVTINSITIQDIGIQDCSTTLEVGAFDCIADCEAIIKNAICVGDTLALNEVGGDAISWLWSSDGDADILNDTAQMTLAVNVTNGELFTVEIVNVNGAVNTCTVEAIVNELPACEIVGNDPICAGDTLKLEEVGGDAVSWEWSTTGGGQFNATDIPNPCISDVQNGDEFTVVITDNNGCTSTCSYTATVNDLPVCSVENSGPICEGDTLFLSENGGDAVAWMWSSDLGTAIINADDQNPFVLGASDGEVFTCVITDADGCMSMCNTTAEVLPAPEVTASSNSPVCVGDMLILSAEASGGTPPYSYSWSNADGFISSNQNVYISDATMDDAGDYELVVTDAGGCVVSDVTSVTINLNLTDPGSIEADQYFCGPGFDAAPITEVDPPSGAPGVIDFFWMAREEGGDWEIIPGADGPTYDPGEVYVTTEYSRCVRIDGCLKALESNIVTVTIGEEAIADPFGPASPCVDDLAIYSVTEQAGATYFWNFGPGSNPPTANTAEATVSWGTMGVRTVSVTVTTATCTANNFIDVFVTDSPVYCGNAPNPSQQPDTHTLALEEVTYMIFPNPSDGRIQVMFDQPLAGRADLRLINPQGTIMQEMQLPEASIQTELNLTDIPSGVYILIMDIGGELRYHERIVKR
jgi:hypothetical protein